MIQRTPPRRLLLITLLASALGFAGGGAAWVLLKGINALSNAALFHRWSAKTPPLATWHPGVGLFIAAVLGAIVIALLAKWSPVIKGHGIPEAMEAVLTKQSRIAPRTAIAKPVSAAIAIGTGAPFGAEGPIIVTGGAIGSLVGQVVPVSPSERKILLAAGAAAGMAATFGSPLAAVVLAIELLLFEFSARALVPLVVSTAIAGGVHAALFGYGPLFPVPSHDYAGLGVLPAFVVLGLACGLLAALITRGLFLIEAGYRRLPIGEFWHPAIGAVLFATVGVIVPRSLGVGYGVIGDILTNKLALGTVAAIAVAKLIGWWFALGSGTSGGTLAPILMISGAFGTVVGSGLNHVLPGRDVALGAFALVAMAATFGAATRATFASVVFVFELTRDYTVIVPLMLATVLADLVYNALNEDSIMTEKLTRRGLRVGRHYGVDPFTMSTVRQIMTDDVETLDAGATVGDARARFVKGGHGAYPIVEAGGGLKGIVSRGDVIREAKPDDEPVLGIASTDLVCVTPDDSAYRVLQVMVDEEVEHVPVVRDNLLVGICSRTDLLRIRRAQFETERWPIRRLNTRLRSRRPVAHPPTPLRRGHDRTEGVDPVLEGH